VALVVGAREHEVSLESQDLPVPLAREVVVEIRSAGVGWVDLLMASGLVAC